MTDRSCAAITSPRRCSRPLHHEPFGDAWARIRTWEPLREGILSPSPLTGLGYPRAAAHRPRSVKPFPSRSRSGDTNRGFFQSGLLRNRGGPSMVQYFTKEFFDELADRKSV